MPVRERPCRVCRKWFQPHPRAGDRQRVCGAETCQRERHRRSCREWHKAHPDYDRSERVRKRFRPEPAIAGVSDDPLHQLDWSAARDAVGTEVSVMIEESSAVLRDWARDAVLGQGLETTQESVPHGGRRLRDDIAYRRGGT